MSSIDGFCSIISFKKGEIGEVYLEPEKENMDIENGGDDECTKTSGNQTSASKSEGSSAAADKQNGVGGNSISDSTNLFKPKKNEEDLIKEPVATTIQVRKKLGVAKTENNTPESEKIASVIQVKKKSSSSPSSPAVASSDAKEPPEAMPIQIKKKPSSKASTEKPVNTIQTKKKPSSSSSAAATAAPANSIQFKKKPGPKAEEKMDVDESS